MYITDTRAAQILHEAVIDSGLEIVAKKLKVSVSHVYRIIAGDRTPRLQILRLAERHFDIPLAAWTQRGLTKSEKRRIG